MACNVSYVPKKCGGVWCAAYQCNNAYFKKKPGLSFFQISEPAVAVSRVSIHENTVTRGNKFKLQNQSFNHNFRKIFYSDRTVNIWNSLPNYVVTTCSLLM